MTSRASRLYERWGSRYLILAGVAVVGTGFVATAITGVAAILYLEVPSPVFVGISVRGGIGCVVATVLSVLTALRILQPVIEWIRGRRGADHAVAAWTAGSRRLLPTILVGIAYFSIGVLPAEVYAAQHARMPLYGSLLMWVGVEIFIIVAAIVDFFSVEALFRPLLRDVARYLPPDFELPHSRLRLRWRLIFLSSVIALFTGLGVGGGISRAHTPESRLAVGLGVGFAMASTVSLLLTALVTRSVASPVERLVVASRAIERGDLSARVPVTTADELGVLGHRFNQMVRGLQERESLQAAMGMYVDPEVAKRIVEEGQLLEGTEVEVTILFLDIRDFTTLSETMNARDAISYLNGFFQLVEPIIDVHGGHVNKFTGDGLLAAFGVPEGYPDQAARAVAAAREITARVAGANPSLRIGIGLNSGTVAAGTVGGGMHLEYTLIGDTVNVAARVEQLTKGSGDSILMTEATRSLCTSDDLEYRGSLRLRGVARDVAVYAALPLASRDRTASVEPSSPQL